MLSKFMAHFMAEDEFEQVATSSLLWIVASIVVAILALAFSSAKSYIKERKTLSDRLAIRPRDLSVPAKKEINHDQTKRNN